MVPRRCESPDEIKTGRSASRRSAPTADSTTDQDERLQDAARPVQNACARLKTGQGICYIYVYIYIYTRVYITAGVEPAAHRLRPPTRAQERSHHAYCETLSLGRFNAGEGRWATRPHRVKTAPDHAKCDPDIEAVGLIRPRLASVSQDRTGCNQSRPNNGKSKPLQQIQPLKAGCDRTKPGQGRKSRPAAISDQKQISGHPPAAVCRKQCPEHHRVSVNPGSTL